MDEGSPIDHRGRSRPLYTPRSKTPRPQALKGRDKLIYGLFPGLRVMATEGFSAGGPVAGLALLVIGVGIFLFTSLDVTLEVLKRVDARPEVALIQIGLWVLAVTVFELLRLGSSGFERSRGPRAPRALATVLLPALALGYASMTSASLAPRLTEATFVTAFVLALGSLPAAVYCAIEVLMAPSEARRRAERGWVGAAGAVSGLVLVWLAFWPHPVWSARADWTGWDVVAVLLR